MSHVIAIRTAAGLVAFDTVGWPISTSAAGAESSLMTKGIVATAVRESRQVVDPDA